MNAMRTCGGVTRSVLALIAQPVHNSGLPKYLQQGFREQECDVHVVDARAHWVHRLWPALRAYHPNRDVWNRRRWERGLFSASAWQRNTRRNGRLIDGLREKPDFILQIGNCYFPHPRYRDLPYHLFITAPLRQAIRDGKPWRPSPPDIPPFMELERQLYGAARRIFVPAEYVKACLVETYGVDAARIAVVGMGVDPAFLRNPVSVPGDLQYRCLFVGWDFEMKGGPVLLEAFRQARATIPRLELDVVGPSPKPQWRLPGVNFLGAVKDRARLLRHYRNADLFVMPSPCDSFGFVFLEAMSQGLPCIGCHVNAMPDIIREGETGYLVPPGDPKALSAAILRFYDDPRKRVNMGKRARERVEREYTWDRVVGDMLENMKRADSP